MTKTSVDCFRGVMTKTSVDCLRGVMSVQTLVWSKAFLRDCQLVIEVEQWSAIDTFHR